MHANIHANEGAFGHPLHRDRRLHAQAGKLLQWRHRGNGQGLCRLLQIRAAHVGRRHIRDQDEEKPEVRDRGRRDVHAARRAHGLPCAVRRVEEVPQGRPGGGTPREGHHVRGREKEQGKARLAIYQRHGYGPGGHCRHLPQEMGHRATLQAIEAKLPLEVLLRRERQCH